MRHGIYQSMEYTRGALVRVSVQLHTTLIEYSMHIAESRRLCKTCTVELYESGTCATSASPYERMKAESLINASILPDIFKRSRAGRTMAVAPKAKNL